MHEDLQDVRSEIVGRLREAALRGQDARFDRAASALDALEDERAWRHARLDLTVPLVAAGMPPSDAGALARDLAHLEII